jgi:hypothetical protein
MQASAGDPRIDSPSGGVLEGPLPSIHYIHLCSGEVVQVAPVTGVQVTDNAILVLNGAEIVGTYPRSTVYFVSDRPMEPPSLN